jgi:hypothetical protein
LGWWCGRNSAHESEHPASTLGSREVSIVKNKGNVVDRSKDFTRPLRPLANVSKSCSFRGTTVTATRYQSQTSVSVPAFYFSVFEISPSLLSSKTRFLNFNNQSFLATTKHNARPTHTHTHTYTHIHTHTHTHTTQYTNNYASPPHHNPPLRHLRPRTPSHHPRPHAGAQQPRERKAPIQLHNHIVANTYTGPTLDERPVQACQLFQGVLSRGYGGSGAVC